MTIALTAAECTFAVAVVGGLATAVLGAVEVRRLPQPAGACRGGRRGLSPPANRSRRRTRLGGSPARSCCAASSIRQRSRANAHDRMRTRRCASSPRCSGQDSGSRFRSCSRTGSPSRRASRTRNSRVASRMRAYLEDAARPSAESVERRLLRGGPDRSWRSSRPRPASRWSSLTVATLRGTIFRNTELSRGHFREADPRGRRLPREPRSTGRASPSAGNIAGRVRAQLVPMTRCTART